jgi:arylsulfatase A-like enzyme/Flp pilus assembly protein TadD
MCAMRFTAVLAALALAGCRSQTPSTAPALNRPDVFLITIDTLRADRISPYGYAKATLGFEAFARDSVLFETATTQVPLTLPAHASILTGLYPMAHGIRENSGFVLPPEQRTLAEILKDNGYSTAAFVGAFVLDGRFGLAQGFDTYFDDFPTGTLEDVQLMIQERRAAEVLSKAREWIRSAPGPRLAWIHLYDPHAPYEAPPPFDRDEDLYDGELAYVDHCLAEFFDFLREQGRYDSSLIIVTSDHGEGLGEHGEETHGMFLYESTLRVPLLIKYPGNSRGGTRNAAPAQLVDVFPTVLRVLNIQDRASVQGRALQPDRAVSPNRADIAETLLPFLGYGWSPLRSYREGNIKLIDAPRPELYDLAADPKETQNLASGDQATAGKLRALLGESTGRLSAAKPPPQSDVDAETSERLRSLGYVSASRPASGIPQGLADPKDRIALFEGIWKAEKKLASGEAAAAGSDLERIVAQDGRVYLARWLLGLAYYKQQRFGQAFEQFTSAASLREHESRPWLYAGLSALRAGRLPQAQLTLEKALALEPGDETILNNLGSLYVNKREFDRAAAIFTELTKRNSRDIAAWSNAGVVFLMKKDYPAAHDAFRRALDLNPDQPEIHNNLGLVQMERGEVDAAISSYRRAITLRPEYGLAHHNLGLALQKKGLETEAAREFALARQLSR